MTVDATLLALGAFAFLAGFVDAVVGGGGLIQLPALLAFCPGLPPATIVGTNKVASLVGLAGSTAQYVRAVPLDWRATLPAALAAFAASIVGALALSYANPALLRPLIFVLLVGIALYTALRRDFGAARGAPLSPNLQLAGGLAAGAVLGFYDGFFGPGTGTFLIFTFIRLFAMDFLAASGSAKVVNASTNIAALCWFIPHGHVLWGLALPMAVCNFAGSWCGAHLAVLKGSRFVRIFFLCVVSALIAKVGYDLMKS